MESENVLNWDELLKKAQQRDQLSQTALFEQLMVTLQPIVQYRLRGWSREDQADILQNTLITVFRKLDSVESNPHKYAARILRNKIGDAYRGKHPGQEVSIDTEFIKDAVSQYRQDDSLQSTIDHRDLVKSIKKAIKGLSTFCQTFFLGTLEQKDRDEIFTVLQAMEPSLSRGTFRKRIFECRQKLKALIQELK